MRGSIRWVMLALMMLALTITACGRTDGEALPSPTPAASAGESGAQGETRVVRLVTHSSFSISDEVLASFEEANNARVEFVPMGDTGLMVNQSVLSVNNPLGDVLFGVDNTFLARALEGEIFEPYEAPGLATVPDEFELDKAYRVVPVDYGDVCLNYDRSYFENEGLAPPGTLEDLILPEYKGLTVVENPATSSPGLAFLLATVTHFGEDGWQAYWSALRENDMLVTSDWSEAYFDQFTAGGGEGTYPIVVSYASSPPAAEGQTASVLADGSCFRQIEFAGVLKNGRHPDLARALVDFMLSLEFQNDVAEQMFVFPVVEGATLPDSFVQYAEIPERPTSPDPAYIEANRDALIEEWTAIVLR